MLRISLLVAVSVLIGASACSSSSGADGGSGTDSGGPGNDGGPRDSGTPPADGGGGGDAGLVLRSFPPTSIIYQDISDAGTDPNSLGMINTLADAGGWGTPLFQIDFGITVLYADNSVPRRTFTPNGVSTPDCDLAPFPVPPVGNVEGSTNYLAGEVDVEVLVAVDGPDGDIAVDDVVLAVTLVQVACPGCLVVTMRTTFETVVELSVVKVGEVGQRHRERGGGPVDAIAAVHAPVAVDFETAVRGGTEQAWCMSARRAGAHGRGESATTCEPERGEERQRGAD
jgi:hypothetical protein